LGCGRRLPPAHPLAFGTPGGAFGDFLYVTTVDTREVLRVAADGTLVDFLTGLQALNGYNGDLAFTNDGEPLGPQFLTRVQESEAPSQGRATTLPAVPGGRQSGAEC
jgi:hypothetical protein